MNMGREPELRDYILALRRARWAIVAWVLLCAGAVFIRGSLQPPVYRASAAVVLLPSKLQTQLTPAHLTLKAYEALLFSDSILADVARKSKIKGMTPDYLRKAMKVEFVMERVGPAQEYAPILLLSAKSKKPKNAKLLANLWAEELIAKSSALRKNQTAEALDTLEQLLDKTYADLTVIDERMTAFSVQGNLRFLETRLATLQEKLTQTQKDHLDVTARISQLSVTTLRRGQLIAAMEKDNSWIGAIRPEEMAGGKPAVNAAAVKDFFVSSVLRSRNALVDTEKDIIKYQQKFDIEIEAQQKGILTQNLQDRKKELLTTLHDLKTQKPRVDKLRVELSKQSQLIELTTAIDDQALWMRISPSITVEDAKTLADMKLKSQVVNPVYFNNLSDLLRMEAEFKALEDKKNYLEAEVKSLSDTLRTLDVELEKNTAGVGYLRKMKEIESKNYEALAQSYNDSRSALVGDKQQLEIAMVSERNLGQEIARMTLEFNTLVEQTERLRFEQQRLTTERETINESFKMLSQKAEEARIERAHETADLKLAARAVAPERAETSDRMKKTLMAAAVAFMVGVAFAAGSEFVRLTLAAGGGEARGEAS